ncbi:hypothetical protein GCM10010145_60360 [Streptomyces ruber]|uniref:Uncharacterized protein n=2 Tax=Streptomyces TaxID=1883 RepID=A0A918EWK7_9ACTN|nr:hypothetical protein [Streptomyces ruber]GGQ82670.1 hypothetical protein GCM10010145_60360 [Streptomyces ruber]
MRIRIALAAAAVAASAVLGSAGTALADPEDPFQSSNAAQVEDESKDEAEDAQDEDSGFASGLRESWQG